MIEHAFIFNFSGLRLIVCHSYNLNGIVYLYNLPSHISLQDFYLSLNHPKNLNKIFFRQGLIILMFIYNASVQCT